MEVIRSIDFDRVTVETIMVEQLGATFQGVIESDIAKYLNQYGFTPTNKFNRTVFYEKTDH